MEERKVDPAKLQEMDKAKEEMKEKRGKLAPDELAQSSETSSRVTPNQEEVKPHDTVKDAKDRWDSESPAMIGQPNRIDPKPENEDISPKDLNKTENFPEEDVDPSATKNIK